MSCDLCGGENLRSVLDLGSSPPACGGEGTFPLELVYCDDCGLTQLSEDVDPEVSFPPSYPYASGYSVALRKNFQDLATHATEYLGSLSSGDLVVDIGANDGTLLKNFAGCKTVGVEPTEQAAHIEGTVYQEFFSCALAKRIRSEHGPARVVTACNVLAHVADIHDVMRGISHLLADDGILVAENHDLTSVLNGQWDTIYHEHLRFYSAGSFGRLLGLHGLYPQEINEVHTHGGSLRTLAVRRHVPDFDKLAGDAASSRIQILEVVKGGAWGIGATARATTLINYCGLDVGEIDRVCEVPGSDKIGHNIPGTSIPIVDESELFSEQPPRALLFSWHLADQIVPKLRERGYEGDIIVPLPEVRSV